MGSEDRKYQRRKFININVENDVSRKKDINVENEKGNNVEYNKGY